MRGRKLATIVTSLLLGVQAVLPIPVALASETEIESSEVYADLSYWKVAYDGNEQIVSINEGVDVRFIGWKDETKSAIVAEYLLTEEDGTTKIVPFEFFVTEEVTESKIESTDPVRYHIVEAEEFQVQEVSPVVTMDFYLPITLNENGTAIEQAVIIDENGLILDKKDEYQYILEEGETRTTLTQEEYTTLNEEPVESEIVEEAEVVEETIEETTEVADEVEEPSTVADEPMMTSMMMTPFQLVTSVPTVSYSTHVQSIGWQQDAINGETAGTQGEAKRLEAIKVNVNDPDLGITYSTHVEKNGWMPEVSNGAVSGTFGEAKRLEAIKLNLVGTKAAQYDIYYRVHAQSYGWLGWAKNGEPAGTEGLAKRLEAIEIMLVDKGDAAPGDTANAFVVNEKESVPNVVTNPLVSYSTYVQGQGWQANVNNGALSGTEGLGRRIEGLRVGIENVPGVSVRYSTHMQSHGWTDWSNGAAINGYPGSGKRMEAVKLELTGQNANLYDVYYRVHAQGFGWLGWAKNGEPAGTEGYAYRAEAIEIRVLPKGEAFDQIGNAFHVKDKTSIVYSSHIQTIGWINESRDGASNGTTGRGLRMEAMKVSLNHDRYSGGVNYRTNVQSHGWMAPVTNGQISGTTGQGKQVEAVQLNLTGEIAEKYDIYYRVHAQGFGWLGWARNGMSAGTEGMRRRVENIEIKLIEKGLTAPAVNESTAFIKAEPQPEVKRPVVFIDPGHGGSDTGAYYYSTAEKTLNMQIAFRVERLLKEAGFDVIMSRTTDVFIDHKTKRSEMANATNADIFISLHNNAMPGNSNVNGIETFWYEYDPNYQPAINKEMHNDPNRLIESEKLAYAVQNALISATGAYNRRVQRDTFAVLRETKIPAILVEFGFMSNPTELNKLKTGSYQETLAKALTDGVVQYFKNK